MNKLKYLILFAFGLWTLNIVAAGKPVKISYTYTYRSNDPNESKAQAEQRAYERAKQKALEERFGVDVSSIIVTMETEQAQNGKFSNDESFFSLGGTMARGEWIGSVTEELLGTPVFNGDFWQVQVRIEGTAREKFGEPIDIRHALVNDTSDHDNRNVFYDKNDLFLRFSSPVDGALCVYLIDAEKQAYCLLPLDGNGQGSQAVKADEEYLFFLPDSKQGFDGYELTTQQPQESNVIYLVFSPNRFTKAKDKKGGQNWREQNLPRSLSYEEFLHWLAKNQTSDENMLVRTEAITIKKRK